MRSVEIEFENGRKSVLSPGTLDMYELKKKKGEGDNVTIIAPNASGDLAHIIDGDVFAVEIGYPPIKRGPAKGLYIVHNFYVLPGREIPFELKDGKKILVRWSLDDNSSQQT